MLIRSTQINKINRGNLDDFAARLKNMLLKTHSRTFGRLDDRGQNQLIEFFVKAAQKLGFHTENLIARYSNTSLVLGPSFEDRIDAPWLNDVLKKGAVPAEAKMNLFEKYTKNKLKEKR